MSKSNEAGLFERMFPGMALRNMNKRIHLERSKRLYDAAKSTTQRAKPPSSRSGDGVVDHSRGKMRDWARHLDENHDLSIGILDVLVNKIIGNGIHIEPMIKGKDGKLNDRANKDMLKLLADWREKPEVTGELHMDEVERMACRSWLRDGEMLAQHVNLTGFNYETKVPYSLELLEADYLPYELIGKHGNNQLTHGVEKNGWGRPMAYHLLKEHPGDTTQAMRATTDTKRVSADNMIHLKLVRRLRQTRGVTIFHGIINRLDDIKDYEESERIAARIAASFTAYIKRDAGYQGQANAVAGDRSIEMEAGMIMDNMLPGEEIGMVSSDRPNTGLIDFRNGQLKAAAAGTGTGYSSISKDYNGNYAAQRQELVETKVSYTKMTNFFIAAFERPIYKRLIDTAIISGALRLPFDVDMDSIYSAEMRGPGQPWIDPKKEMEADTLAVASRFKSRHQVIRDRDGDPSMVDEQIERERAQDLADGVALPTETGTLPKKEGNDDGEPDKEEPGEDVEEESGTAAAGR